MAAGDAIRLEPLDPWRWRIPRHGAMRTDGIVYADARMIAALRREQALEQVRNVASLPGIVGPALAMPDIHWGYGFPIGGVAAFGEADGIVSPGGVGYDINCGVRLLRTGLLVDELAPHLAALADALYQAIPSGVGAHRRDLRLSAADLDAVLVRGAAWAVQKGFGVAADLEQIESRGALPGADPQAVSDRARQRGEDQLGTLGSGNHFVEVDRVEAVFDAAAADAFGLFEHQVVIGIHTGSRGLGYQVCDDHVRSMLQAARRYGIALPDRQLCCAPLSSPEASAYLAAMAAAANYAFANRQLIADSVARVLARVLGRGPAALKLATVYDVAHNIAKWETHTVAGRPQRLCVHRKGATRAFPPGHPEVPARYRAVGQPVLIPGDMGRCSYVLAGTAAAMEQSFGSTCHGAGRLLSRHAAKQQARGRDLFAELAEQGIELRAAGIGTVAEEISEAYKDVADVVRVVEQAGLGKIVARLRPLAVIKG